MKEEITHEQEIGFMISELAKTEMGQEALKRSAEAIEKSGWKKQANKFMEGGVVEGKTPQGVPFRLSPTSKNY